MVRDEREVAARVGVRELRQNLSVYLERVKAGERMEVTERGRPVAPLVPLPAGDDPLAPLYAEGRAAPPRRDLAAVLRQHPPRRPEPGERSLGEILEAMRAEESL